MEISPVATELNEIPELNDIKRKDHFSGRVVKLALAGAVIDVGLPVPGVLHISQLSAEPVNRVEDVLKEGQTVDVWVRGVFPKKNRIELTMIEPIGLEWREINPDLVVKGKVVRIEKFGVFVDIGAERPGLVHISEITHDYIKSPGDFVKEGSEVEVKVLSVDRKKKQIKLSMKALEEPPVKEVKVKEEKPARASKEPVKAPQVEPEDKEPPIPTAMEIAFREAMERSAERVEPVPPKAKKTAVQNEEMDLILSRTLEQKVQTSR